MSQQPKIIFSVRELAREIECVFSDYLIPPVEGYYFGTGTKPVFLMSPPNVKQYGVKAPEMHFTVYRDGVPNFVPMYYQSINGQLVGLDSVENILSEITNIDGDLVFKPSNGFLQLSADKKKECFSKTPRVPTTGYQFVKDFVDYQIDISSMWVRRAMALGDRLSKYFKVSTREVSVEKISTIHYVGVSNGVVDICVNEVSRSDPLGIWAEEKLRLIMMPIQEDLQRFIGPDNWNIYTSSIVQDMVFVEKGPDYRIEQWEKEHGHEFRFGRSR